MQNHYNLIYREEEREMFPTLKVLPLPVFSHRCNQLMCLSVVLECRINSMVPSR